MAMGMNVNIRERMARRAAKEIKDGMVVNLGIGIPTLVADHIEPGIQVMFHAENGILGVGPRPQNGKEDANLCNAGGFPVSVSKSASYFDSATAFGMIRRGRLDMTCLGALEVSARGDLANWIVPGKRVPGIGGAMELAQKAKKVVILMSHCNKDGESKIVTTCTLPRTAKQCVDLIITDMAVIEVTEKGLLLKELMRPYTIEEVVESTDAPLAISTSIETLA